MLGVAILPQTTYAGKGEKKTLDNDDTTNDSKNNSYSNNNV